MKRLNVYTIIFYKHTLWADWGETGYTFFKSIKNKLWWSQYKIVDFAHSLQMKTEHTTISPKLFISRWLLWFLKTETDFYTLETLHNK